MINRILVCFLFLACPFFVLGTKAEGVEPCYDADELASDAVEAVDTYGPGVVEIDATHNAVIKVGYKYIGYAPVYIKIKDSCVDGQVLPIIAEPGLEYQNAAVAAQRTEFVCGSCTPVRIGFDLESGLRTFSYFEKPKVCGDETEKLCLE